MSFWKHPVAGSHPRSTQKSLSPHCDEMSFSKQPVAGSQPRSTHSSLSPHCAELSISKQPSTGSHPRVTHSSLSPHGPNSSSQVVMVAVTGFCTPKGSSVLPFQIPRLVSVGGVDSNCPSLQTKSSSHSRSSVGPVCGLLSY